MSIADRAGEFSLRTGGQMVDEFLKNKQATLQRNDLHELATASVLVGLQGGLRLAIESIEVLLANSYSPDAYSECCGVVRALLTEIEK